MGCVDTKPHTKKYQALPNIPLNDAASNPNQPLKNQYYQIISRQKLFQHDGISIQSKKNSLAQFAMRFKIKSVMDIIHNGTPFQSVLHLDLSKKYQLQQVDNLQVFSFLESLDLSDNFINQIKNFRFLSNLITLNLGFNQIVKIQNLNHLTQLRHLYLHNNQIQKIENLDQLIQLIELSLGGNKIKFIKKLDTLVNLEILGLQMNEIEKIQNINHLRKLLLLTLGANKIKRIQNLQNLDNLEILSLQDNEISKIQNIYSMTKHLKQIKLEFNFINLKEQDFVLKQIARGGVLIYVEPQKPFNTESVIKKILPSFLK